MILEDVLDIKIKTLYISLLYDIIHLHFLNHQDF